MSHALPSSSRVYLFSAYIDALPHFEAGRNDGGLDAFRRGLAQAS